jgi:hypothetical protein
MMKSKGIRWGKICSLYGGDENGYKIVIWKEESIEAQAWI